MGKLSDDQQAVLDYLAQKSSWTSPTEIGEKVGKRIFSSSSWACKKLKPLLERGLIDRSSKGHYRSHVVAGRNTQYSLMEY